MSKQCEIKQFGILILLGSLAVGALSQTVSEEAQRYFVRGLTAVKMAKSQDDYIAAINQFEHATRLAPDWAEAWFNLGRVQEKAEKFREAVVSLTRFLQLAPNDQDAPNVKTLIYELEYKAEKVLSIPEIIDVLVSFGHTEKGWVMVQGDCFHEHQFNFIKLGSEGFIQVMSYGENIWRDERVAEFRSLKVKGPVLIYISVIDACSGGMLPCPRETENEIEVISKTRVKIRQTQTESGYTFSCEYEKR